MRSRRGQSLLEAIVAVSVVVVGALSAVSVAACVAGGSASEEAERRAALAAAAKLEEVRAVPLAAVAASFGAGAPGAGFDVPGLPGGGTGAGSVTLHVDETASNAALGLPRDLDGDGAAATLDVSTTAVLLPVEVTVTWPGPDGARSFTLATLVAARGTP